MISLGRSVLSSGGTASAGEGLRMRSALGQALVGRSQSAGGDAGLSSGFHPALPRAEGLPTATEPLATPGPTGTPTGSDPVESFLPLSMRG